MEGRIRVSRPSVGVSGLAGGSTRETEKTSQLESASAAAHTAKSTAHFVGQFTVCTARYLKNDIEPAWQEKIAKTLCRFLLLHQHEYDKA